MDVHVGGADGMDLSLGLQVVEYFHGLFDRNIVLIVDALPVGHVYVHIIGSKTLQAVLDLAADGCAVQVLVQLDPVYDVEQGALHLLVPGNSTLGDDRNVFSLHLLKSHSDDLLTVSEVVSRSCIDQVDPDLRSLADRVDDRLQIMVSAPCGTPADRPGAKSHLRDIFPSLAKFDHFHGRFSFTRQLFLRRRTG